MQLGDAVTVTRLHRNTIRKINSRDYPKKASPGYSPERSRRWRELVDRVGTYILHNSGSFNIMNRSYV